ncbi:MAG: hypothetical protein COB24_09175 [Hyphomicrobiales bacterium]|nr:MAG: hypothetical protein COB24_09175 [Hyphomicrobiales bacterium]
MNKNPWKNNKNEIPDLSKLKEIKIPGAPVILKKDADKKLYNKSFTANITQKTHNRIMHIKNNPNPDIKRSLGVIIEQAVELYFIDKAIEYDD